VEQSGGWRWSSQDPAGGAVRRVEQSGGWRWRVEQSGGWRWREGGGVRRVEVKV